MDYNLHLLLLLLMPGIIKSVPNSKAESCQSVLGMQSGEIPDSALSASSSYRETVGPEMARIRQEISGGAWCPQGAISKDSYEWLQVDFPGMKVIVGVETQGRFGNGQGQEFADQYQLHYQREDGGRWFQFMSRRGQKTFQGNTNTYHAELREVDPPIIARRIRFVPYSLLSRHVCLRVELYGCDWTDGTVAYNMTQGEKRGSEVDLLDFTYDGDKQDNYLSGGLGQLTDLQRGEDNFRLDRDGTGHKGYSWVGWKNDTHNGRPIEIVFKFDAVRNFSKVLIHTNNFYSKDTRVFRMAKIYFSVAGKYFTGEPIIFPFMKDSLMEFSREIEIMLLNRIGRFVKILLFFEERWLLISEVSFISEYAIGNFTEELPPTPAPPVKPGVASVDDVIGDNEVDSNEPEKESRQVPPTIVGDKAETKNAVDSPVKKLGDKEVEPAPEKKSIDDQHVGIIIGTLAAILLILFAIVLVVLLRHRRRKCHNHLRMVKCIEPPPITLDLSDLQRLNKSSDIVYNNHNHRTLSDDDSDNKGHHVVSSLSNHLLSNGMHGRRLPDTPEGTTDSRMSRDYAIPDVTKSALLMPPPPQPPRPPSMSSVLGPGYASSDVVTSLLPTIQGVSGNTVYSMNGGVPNGTVPGDPMFWQEQLSLVEFPRDKLKFVEKLGQGQFGEVHLCETTNIMDMIGDDFLINRTGSCSMLVAVKMLQRNATPHARTEFEKEVRLMARLKDPNIVRVLGVCARDEPFCVVVEYMKFGDLRQFLQGHVAEFSTMAKKKHTKKKKVPTATLR